MNHLYGPHILSYAQQHISYHFVTRNFHWWEWVSSLLGKILYLNMYTVRVERLVHTDALPVNYKWCCSRL